MAAICHGLQQACDQLVHHKAGACRSQYLSRVIARLSAALQKLPIMIASFIKEDAMNAFSVNVN